MNAYDLLDYARELAGGSFIYDVTTNAVYMADFNEDHNKLYGIDVFYLKARGKELKQQVNKFGCGLHELCIEGIPFVDEPPNEYGYRMYFGFEYDMKTEDDIAKALLRYVIDEFGERDSESLWTEDDVIRRRYGEK